MSFFSNPLKSFLPAHSIVESESTGTSNSAAFRGGTTASGYEPKSFYRISCPGQSECVPLADCPELLLETARQCYRGDFSLSCGVNELEPHVCCPRTPNRFDDDRNGENVGCGKSIVQGDYYNGLGAFPFVARIGFKSKLRKIEIARSVLAEGWQTKQQIIWVTRGYVNQSSNCQ